MGKHWLSPQKRVMGGKILSALCNILGTLILLSVLAGGVLILVPQLKGIQVYHIISGSMEPEIPVGSLVYVAPIAPEDVKTDDVIAFYAGPEVITHRVVHNFIVEGEFSTKGDNNPAEDENRAHYDDLIGKVERHYPHLGELLMVYSATIGKIYLLLFAACGAMLNILASRIRARCKDLTE